jgi:hypothetical protein
MLALPKWWKHSANRKRLQLGRNPRAPSAFRQRSCPEPIVKTPRREIIARDPQACPAHAVPDKKARHHDHKGGSDTLTLCIGIDIKTEKLARKRQRARALWPAMAKTNDASI